MHKMSNLKSATRQRLGKPGLLLALMTAGVFLSACAGKAPLPDSPGDLVVERAQDRWEALLAGDFETAYAFYSPGYRSTTSMVDLAFEIRSRRVRWTTAEYREHSCLKASCTVKFDVGFRVIKPVPGLDKWESSDLLTENWVKTDGQWWYLPKK